MPIKSKMKTLQNFVSFSEYMNFICGLNNILDPEGQPDLTWPNFLAGEPNSTKIGSGLPKLMQRYSNSPSKQFNPIVQEQPVTPLFAYPDFSRTMLTQKHVLNGAQRAKFTKKIHKPPLRVNVIILNKLALKHQYGSLGVPQTPKSCDTLIARID